MKNIFDYDVYDRSGDKVGTVENLWANDAEELGFIGIRTGWLGMGQNHLIPAQGVSIDDNDRIVRVPYDEDVIKNSPSFESDGDLGDDLESRVFSHFGVTGYSGTTAGMDTSYGSDRRTRQGAAYSSAASDRRTVGDDETIEVPLAEEELHVGKRRKELGEVRLRKVVRTETVNQPIELQHEEVVVERVQGRQDLPGAEAFTEDVVSIPVSEEEAVVEKTVRSAGAVQARKVVEREEQSVSDTVRKEDVEVERDYSQNR